VAIVRQGTIPTKRPPLVGGVSAIIITIIIIIIVIIIITIIMYSGCDEE
jgi:hypothetical protein